MTGTGDIGGGELNAAVTREVIHLHAEATGKGPDRAYSMHQGNLVLTVLEGTMTPGERRLARNGQGEEVRRMKRLVHQMMEPELRERITRITGRPVLALLGDSHLEPDLVVSIFVLHPEPTALDMQAADRAR
ncbi:MAG TPA: Na-translocating system protein MpsC family protein [Solirubrobacterales bacterium]|nr:Na-translocating system protein MpsC family protein [Solirubrobacterales bacterium]